MAQRRLGLGERQQVVKIDGLARRLGDMFRDERGLVALNEGPEAREMRLVQGCGPPIDMHTPCSETAWSLRTASRAR
jgi:hypothetical protein